MFRKVSLKLVLVGASLLTLVISASAADKAAVKDSLVNLTITELAKYDGKDGHKAYVAIDSVIYDVSKVKAWKNGEHNGNKAGTEVSAQITKAPHGKSVLKKLPVVGKLVAEASAPVVAPATAAPATAAPVDTTKK